MAGGIEEGVIGALKCSSVKTAVAVVPPRTVWGPIQAFRRLHDPVYCRWPPHINILYPFVEPENVADEGVQKALAEAVKGVDVFDVEFAGSVGRFGHGKVATLWLNPVEQRKGAWKELSSALEGCCVSEKKRKRFVPHLSVAKVGKKDDLDASAAIATEESLRGFSVDRVTVLRRKRFSDPFEVAYQVKLGSGEVVDGKEWGVYEFEEPEAGNPYHKK